MKIKVGQRVRDDLSGFEGIVYGITEYLYGCRQVAIKPTELDKDGNLQTSEWFDEPQCSVVPKAKTLKSSGNTGGPREVNPNKR